MPVGRKPAGVLTQVKHEPNTPSSGAPMTPIDAERMGTTTPSASPTHGLEKLDRAASLVLVPTSGPLCTKCGQHGNENTLGNKFDMVSTNGNKTAKCKALEHSGCKRTYGSLTRKWGKDRAIKLWWDVKSDDTKVQFYCEHLAIDRELGAAVNLCIEASELKQVSTGTETRGRDAYLPFIMWKRNMRVDHPQMSDKDMALQWSQLLQSKHPKVWNNNQWNVLEYQGVLMDTVDSSMNSFVTKKTNKCLTRDQLQGAVSEATDAMAESRMQRDNSRVAVAPSAQSVPVPREMVQGVVSIVDDVQRIDMGQFGWELQQSTQSDQALTDAAMELAELEEWYLKSIEVWLTSNKLPSITFNKPPCCCVCL
jgi:hypothetical protein